MAFMATSKGVPFSSMPSRISTASSLVGAADSTFSCRFTVSSTPGFTSREMMEATVLDWR